MRGPTPIVVRLSGHLFRVFGPEVLALLAAGLAIVCRLRPCTQVRHRQATRAARWARKGSISMSLSTSIVSLREKADRLWCRGSHESESVPKASGWCQRAGVYFG